MFCLTSNIYFYFSDLNDNEWHRLQISLDINTGGFAVSLDFFTSQNRQLRAFKDIKKVLKWSELLSVIYYGGKATSFTV